MSGLSGPAAIAAGLGAAAGIYLCVSSKQDGKRHLKKPLGKDRLHKLDPQLQSIGRAKTSTRKASAHRQHPKQTHVVRIALTGGPCAGKSSCLGHIIENATCAGFDVYTAPEVATLLFNSGVQLPLGDAEGMFVFQSSLIGHQLSLERTLTRIAASTGRPSIIIFDRGCMDAKGYMDAETWQRVLAEANSTDTDSGTVKKGVTESYLLARYDGVLHLITAADGARQFYKSGQVQDDAGHDVIRRETADEAVELDKKMRKCWSSHPNHMIIENGPGGFKAKLNGATEAVLELARKTHPDEYARAKPVVSEPANA